MRVCSKLCFTSLALNLAVLFLPVIGHAAPDEAGASPKPGWGDFDVEEEDASLPIWSQILLWPVNRVLDIVDVFRVDVGAGTSTGGVVRITRGLQMGYRDIGDGSLRIGGMGRTFPVLLEEGSEKGFAGGFQESSQRDICDGELAIGVDLFLAAHLGICLDETADLVAGIFFLDPLDDDIR